VRKKKLKKLNQDLDPKKENRDLKREKDLTKEERRKIDLDLDILEVGQDLTEGGQKNKGKDLHLFRN
jgi:hypothetical protein